MFSLIFRVIWSGDKFSVGDRKLRALVTEAFALQVASKPTCSRRREVKFIVVMNWVSLYLSFNVYATTGKLVNESKLCSV